jgi:outer membrane lipoprotein-sorting protein
MTKPFVTGILALCAGSLFVFGLEAQDAASIVRRLDSNEVYATLRSDAEFFIQYGGKRIVKSFTMYARGDKDSFVEFTNPEDAGTKMLKKDGKLFLYSPDAEEVIPITGHLLKESLMGSDLSYEDTVANDTLESLYNASILEESAYAGKPCWVLELIGKKKTISYPKLRMWVEKSSCIPLKTERYALSGALLKEERVLETRDIGGRLFPVKVEVRDLLRKDSKTTFTFTNTRLDAPMPDSLFSMRNLQR